MKTCALPGCSRGVGNPTYTYNNSDYCSRTHYEYAIAQHTTKGKKMQVIAEDFGEAGVTRRYCDRRECGKACVVVFKGRDGEYCSNECRNLVERQGEEKMTTEETNGTATAAAPITAGTSAKKTTKKAAKPAAKKAAAKAKKTAKPAKKAAKKAAAAKATSEPAVFPRPGSKTETIVKMLRSGATREQLEKEIEWAWGAFGSTFALIKQKLNVTIVTKEGKDKTKKYFIE